MTEQKKVQTMKGLTDEEVRMARNKYGKNELIPTKKESLFLKILEVLKEPMFLLLLVAAVIYFILGEPQDGVVMLVFVLGIISIDIIQEWKTDKTLSALKNLSAPHITVIRNGVEKSINSEELVPNDLMIITEGVKIPADGNVLVANDLCVDESSLTGEAEGVWKCIDDNNSDDYWRRDYCYAGTLVTQGRGIVRVDKIGKDTEYGKIGVNISEAPDTPTPLQKQTGKLVKICATIAAVLFVLVCIITYFNLPDHSLKERVIESILSGITLAMAMIPEEFPVILTVFLSMGAWRLAKKNSLVRKLPSVETLGAISVLCVDKTGTITMNKMALKESWALKDIDELDVTMGMACETDPYDPMEQAMLKYCEDKGISKDQLFKGRLVTEYSFTNEKKMMGHVWENDGVISVSAKGSPEKILDICLLSGDEKKKVEEKMYEMSSKGLRVIGVGKMIINNGDIPKSLEECKLEFLGLIGLQDPPREGIKDDIKMCLDAGIRVVMITGDNGITASSIAKEVGIPHSQGIITGEELNKMDDEELNKRIKDVSIFSRVVPEHKMRIVKAFKEIGEVVAMTGDGVNDAPALKYADIGIAMGKRGSEVSREAADLILLDDNFSTIVDTVKDGRRIYDNIRKAIGYVFVIHMPIAFASLLAPLLGISASSLLLLPVHVVLLELLIDPTCSIVLERQPAESDIMNRKPRDPREGILTSKVLVKSIIQGLVLFAASFGTYYYYLIKLRKDKVMWSVAIGTIVGLVIILYTPLSGFLGLVHLGTSEILKVCGISLVSILWYEVVKLFKK